MSVPYLKAIAEEFNRKNYELLKTLPPKIRFANILHYRFLKVKDEVAKEFVRFAKNLLERDATYVFLERDAIPAKNVLEIFAKESGRKIDSRSIAVTRDLLPKKLRISLGSIDTREYIFAYNQVIDDYSKCGKSDLALLNSASKRRFETEQGIIKEYVNAHKGEDTLLHRYLMQELNGVKNPLFIDTGFWGKCTGYPFYFFEGSDYILYYGPMSSKHIVTAISEEAGPLIMDHIDHGHSIDGLIDGEKISVDRTQNHYQNRHVTEYMAIEFAALEDIFGNVPEHKIVELLTKYNVDSLV